MPHLLVDLSDHGFGHLAQTAPVVNARAEIPAVAAAYLKKILILRGIARNGRQFCRTFL